MAIENDSSSHHEDQRLTAGIISDSSIDIRPGLFENTAKPDPLDDIKADKEEPDYDDEAEGLISGDKLSQSATTQFGEDGNNDDNAGVTFIVVPTKTLSIIILLFLLITHSLLGWECTIATKSFMTASKQEGHLAARAITSWKVLPGNKLIVRATRKISSSIVAEFSASEAASTEFEVYGKSYNTYGTKRVHVISPVNGWATEITYNGKRFMEPILPEKEGVVEKANDISFCPIYDAGYTTNSTSSRWGRWHYAPASLVVAQQFWNAAQVLYFLLLICLFVTMASPSSSSASSSIKRTSTMASVKAGKCILWCFLVLFTILTIVLLPFSVYFFNPGGHALALVMTIISLASVYFSTPNVQFNLADLPPQCCTPQKHPSVLARSKELGEQKSYADDDNRISTETSSFTFVNGRGLCKVELIAFLCNLFSSMYNYNTSLDYIFPYWYKIFHGIDKWLGLLGGSDYDIDENHKVLGSSYEVIGRFIYNMGVKKYHFPLFMPLAYGSTIGSYVFLFLWSILPFIYVVYFMTMYAMAKHAPGVKIQRFFALFGVFHFLFLTDVVSYKYGRGIRNELSEHCHWAERFAWRIGILLPIYQNVLSGHYKRAKLKRCVGVFFHYFIAVWGVVFFVYQFLLNDCIHFPNWLMGQSQINLFPYSRTIGYMGTLVVMVFAYGISVFGGTWCHHIYVGIENE